MMKTLRYLKSLPAFLLAAVLLPASLWCSGMELTVYAADSGKTITGLGTGTIANPSSGAGGWNHVYYGKYNGSPVKYRVLDKASAAFGGNTLLLDCDSILFNKAFDSGNSNKWGTSSLKAELNGSGFYSKEGVFSAAERAAIAASTKSQANGTDGSGTNYHGFAPLNGERIFLLDAVEATCPAYGYVDWGKDYNDYWVAGQREKRGASSYWWLRSPYSITDSLAGFVYSDGFIDILLADDEDIGVSPALNVNLSSVLFSSVISSEPGAYKLTLKDSNLAISNTGSVTKSGNTIKVPCAVTGTSNRVSVLMTDGEWKSTGWSSGASVKYYGSLNASKEFTLPGDYSKDWNVYILAEQVNGEKETDYASAPVKITISEKQKEDQQKDQTDTSVNSIPDVEGKEQKGASYYPLCARQKKVAKKSITITWKKVKGATSYTVYGCRCGQNQLNKLKTVYGTTYTQTKLKAGTFYKYYVEANRDGTVIAKSVKVHAATKGKRRGNPSSVKINKKSVKLKVGKSWKIKATVKKTGKVSRHRSLSYESTNPKVATVSKKGKVKAVAAGTCSIYVYEQNGIYKKVKITVK